MNTGLWRVFEEQTIDGKYALLKLLGVGSYGGVFLADEVVADRLIRQVAVKLMETDPAGQDAQMRELIAAANLDHPGLLRSFTCGLCKLNRIPLLYLVTELAEETLEDRIQAGVVLPEEVRAMAVTVASALAYLHGQSSPLVHRDIKPANIMRAGANWKLGDFGLLRAVDSQNPMQTGTMVGTAAYAPPESYRGAVTPAWDVWSLGVLLTETLTGRLPFEGDTPHRMMIAVSSQDPVLPPDLPDPFGSVIRGCLVKDSGARWSAERALDALSSGPSIPLPSASRLPDAFYARMGPPSPTASADKPLIVSPEGDGDFRGLDEAVISAPAGATVRVLPGVYTEPILLDRPITIEGAGDPGTVVIETRGTPCLVMRTGQALVRGLKLVSRADMTPGPVASFRKHPAVEIGQGELTLESCEISCASTVCVAIHGPGTRPTLRDCRIHDGKAGGVLFEDRAGGIIERCEVLGCHGPGVAILSGAAPSLVGCDIHDGLESGVTIEAAAGVLEDCDIHANAGPGLAVGAAGTPEVKQCRLFLGAQAGISVRDGGQGVFDECEIYGNMLSNVHVAQGANPHLRRCRIHDGHSNGIWVSQNGQGVIENCEIFGNTFAGLKISHGGNPLVRRTTLRDGKRTGVSLHERSRATLIDCDIASHLQTNVLAEYGANLILRQCIVRDGLEGGIQMACDGLLDGVDVSGCAGPGIELRPGGKPILRSCRVHDGQFLGVLANGGVQAILEDCDIYANALPGVAVGEGSRVDVRACRLYNGQQVGIVFWDQGRGVVENCEIHGNALGGIRIRLGSDPLIRNCRINRNGYHGIHVSERAEGAVIHCDLTDNQMDPLFVEAGCTTQTADNTP